MRSLTALLAHSVMGLVGLIFGALSAVALAIAAVIPAALGLLAFVFAPLRTLRDRLRRPRSGAVR